MPLNYTLNLRNLKRSVTMTGDVVGDSRVAFATLQLIGFSILNLNILLKIAAI